MFTVEQRDTLRERVLGLGVQDDRVVAGAIVGSLAVDGGDRFSDLDLTFGIADGVRVADVLDETVRGRSSTSSMRHSSPSSSAARPPTACSCCRTRCNWISR